MKKIENKLCVGTSFAMVLIHTTAWTQARKFCFEIGYTMKSRSNEEQSKPPFYQFMMQNEVTLREQK